MFQTVFKRYESKYFTDSRQYAGVLRALERYTKPDRYGRSRICSVYYDTPDRRLIRASLEKPVYKEKLRLRTYGVPQDGSSAFIEIKKKYKGVVCKRRIPAAFADALKYLSGDTDCLPPSHIKSETDFFLSRYAPLEPGSAKEILSIFMAMAAGLGTGVGYIGLTAVFVLAACGANILFTVTRFGEQPEGEREIRITVPESLNYTDAFDDLFEEYTAFHRLKKVKTSNMGSLYQLTYTVRLKNPAREKELIDSMRCRNGNLDIISSRCAAVPEEL